MNYYEKLGHKLKKMNTQEFSLTRDEKELSYYECEECGLITFTFTEEDCTHNLSRHNCKDHKFALTYAPTCDEWKELTIREIIE